MSVGSIPTMEGFEWSRSPGFVPAEPGEDGWCLRDAICLLFGWERDSEEWQQFREWPAGQDTPRLVEHLGLTIFRVPEDWDELHRNAAHPGVAYFTFPKVGKAHTVYVPDIRVLLRWWPTSDGRPCRQPPRSTGWPLGPQHMARGPVLGAVLVDERESPRVPS